MKKKIINKKDVAFNSFVSMVEQNYKELTDQYMNDLLKNPDTMAYRKLNRQTIYKSSAMIYKDLSKWIAREYPKDKIADRYLKIGRERFEEGIPFSQAQKALVLQMRHLWIFVMSMIEDNNIKSITESIELNNRVALYFQRAIFYMLKGYEEEIFNDFTFHRE